MSAAVDTGISNVNNANSQGQSALGAFDPNAWNATTQAGLSGIKNSQDTTQNNYVQAYKDQIAANPSATDLYNTAYNKFNVGGLQNTSNQLNNAVLTAPQQNIDAAKGFAYDQGQIDQKTNQDLSRLSPLAIAAQNNSNTAQGNASNYVNAGLQQNATNLLPIQEQGTYLQDAYARQQSGYSTTQQAALTALQDKLDKGIALSTAEMQSYQALASSEASYQSALATANASVQAAKIGQQYQTVTSGQNLVNTFANTILNPSMLTSKTGVATYG